MGIAEATFSRVCTSRLRRLHEWFGGKTTTVVPVASGLSQAEVGKIAASFKMGGAGEAVDWAVLVQLLLSLGICEAEKLLTGLGFAPDSGPVCVQEFLLR